MINVHLLVLIFIMSVHFLFHFSLLYFFFCSPSVLVDIIFSLPFEMKQLPINANDLNDEILVLHQLHHVLHQPVMKHFFRKFSLSSLSCQSLLCNSLLVNVYILIIFDLNNKHNYILPVTYLHNILSFTQIPLPYLFSIYIFSDKS